MPVRIAWANAEKTIVRWNVSGNFEGQDFVDAIKDYAGLMNGVEHEFYMLLDLTAASGSAIGALNRFPEIARGLPRKRAASIVAVGSSQTVAVATNIFSRVYGGKFEYFTSMDKALAHLRDSFGVRLG
jgi:hypothetical protein